MEKVIARKGVRDFRSAFEDAEAARELVRIERVVDPLLEIPAILRAMRKLPQIPVVLFEKVESFPGFRCAGALFANPIRMSRLLGLRDKEAVDKWSYMDALDNPIKPKLVPTGPCKENVITKNINVEKLIPSSYGAMQVKHRYYQPVVITKHPKTGVVNASVYRAAIQGPDRVTVNFRWDQHGGLILSAAKEMGATVPVALCIGVHPAIYLAATSKLAYGYDELSFAGGLLGEAIELVRCETVDLEVPASAEIVIEGEIRPPYERGSEGPWPEYLEYLGMNIHPPIMDITAITYRNNPINLILIPGTVPAFISAATEAALLRHLRGLAGEFVVDACLTSSARLHHVIVKVKKTEAHHEGLQVNVALAAFGFTNTIDLVTVVDEDINIHDFAQIDWAIASRCNPARQVHILPEARTHQNNPIAGIRDTFGEPIAKAKMIIDATIPWNYRTMEKEPGLTFFSKSQWPEVDLRQYFGAASEKWIR